MTVSRQFAAVLAAFGVILSCAGEETRSRQTLAAATGDPAPEFDVSAWAQGKEVKLSELKGKKYAVLFFWTISKQGTENFPDMAKLAKEYEKKDVAFAGIGIDSTDAVRNFVRLKELPFPVAADDKLNTVNLYMRERDRVPMAALIDKNGTLLWRGNPGLLDSVLQDVLAGKFDLKKAIERETFSTSVMNAMKIRDYPTVLKLLNSELVLYPDNMELVSLKAKLLGTLMNKPDEALAFLNEMIAKNPKELALYELALATLKSAHRSQELGGWFDRIISNFGDQPLLLVKFAQEEMKSPVAELRLDNVLKLCRAAYNAPKFKSNEEKGQVAEEYARVLYFCGRPDKALEVSKESMVLLQGTKAFERAKTSVTYYSNVVTLSKQIK